MADHRMTRTREVHGRSEPAPDLMVELCRNRAAPVRARLREEAVRFGAAQGLLAGAAALAVVPTGAGLDWGCPAAIVGGIFALFAVGQAAKVRNGERGASLVKGAVRHG